MFCLFITCAIAATPALAQDAPDAADRRVYFGEQHLHSVNSTARPAQAERFASTANPAAPIELRPVLREVSSLFASLFALFGLQIRW
jgi:hypothetical protein